VPGFNIPVKIEVSGSSMILNPTQTFQTIHLNVKKAVIKVDPGWYVATLDMTGK